METQAETILVVEDDRNILDAIEKKLAKEGFRVIKAMNGKEALEKFYAHQPDLVLLDLMLPLVEGKEILKEIRSQYDTPVIVVTAREEEVDRILGLELGADDYITKPFSLPELVARIRAVLRRAYGVKKNVGEKRLVCDEISLDLRGHELRVAGKMYLLPKKQFELLRILMSRAGEVLSREYLLNEVWGNEYYGDKRTLDVHVKWLRDKIEPNPNEPRYILTVRGVGYKFNGEVRKE
ncbi:response regulator transcription factor [Coprothermobacteraceae bacterium]|nr:response regulator transcription factor [Coprothermobacteraceae bacterium]